MLPPGRIGDYPVLESQNVMTANTGVVTLDVPASEPENNATA
jgi:hypothetical protein